MAKSIFICSRNPLPGAIAEKLALICGELAPDNIEPRPPKIIIGPKTAMAVMNPSNTLGFKEDSLLMGLLFHTSKDWHIPKSSFPEGSFALFRNSEDFCELVTDAVASRTLWYYHDDEFFIGATSQRAIIMFLNNFDFNEKVIPWMLSTGSLGPEYSWDKRLSRVPPDSSILLDKVQWSITAKTNSIEFKSAPLTERGHKTSLVRKIKETFEQLNLDFSLWQLPLSGGVDSRGLLSLLAGRDDGATNLKTITWGTKEATSILESDACVARDLAEYYKVSNTYYHTDIAGRDMEAIFERFIKLGEGRIDHIAGYMDGFKLWKTLFENGVQGIIRGDEGFGWNQVSSELYVRLCTGLNLCEDFANLKQYEKYGFTKQTLPKNLERRKGESLPQWRDRMYHEYRLPTIIAALTDLKLSYVEQISPFLAKNILCKVRELPDHLRTNKILFREIVNDFNTGIRFATKAAIAKPEDILKTEESIKILKKALSDNTAKSIFPPDFLDMVKGNLKVQYKSTDRSKLMNNRKKALSKFIPGFLKNLVRKSLFQPQLDYSMMAFRVYIVCQMHELLLKSIEPKTKGNSI